MAEETLRVVVVGGSMPAGASLVDKTTQCWPNRLQAMLELAWPRGNVTVSNLAMGGVPSDPQVPILSMSHKTTIAAAHLVIVDIVINDRLKHPWILALDDDGNATGSTTPKASHEGGSGGCMAVEGCELMDALLTMSNRDAGIVYFETFPMSFRHLTIKTPAEFEVAV
jgi:hypothetical protein